MKKTFKKAFSVFLAMALLTILVAGAALSASADFVEDEPATFETWTGSGSTSVTMLWIDHTRFLNLFDYNRDEAVDPGNYTVTGTDDTTVITLKEEYLKTLTNGEYSFRADFEAVPWSFEYGTFKPGSDWSEDEAPDVWIEDLDCTTFFKLTCNDEEVDPSNYTVETSYESIKILLEKDYQETLIEGEYRFDMYFMVPGLVWLDLTVDVQPTTTAEVTTIIEVTTTTEVPELSDDYPQTSDAGVAPVIVLAALAVGVAALTTRTNKKRN